MTLAETIKDAREAKGWTRGELDRQAALGNGATKRIEEGRVRPGADRLERIRVALELEELRPDDVPADAAGGAPPPTGETPPTPPGGLEPEAPERRRFRDLFRRGRPAEAGPGKRERLPRPPRNWGAGGGKRESAADDFGELFEWGAELVGPEHVPTARMLAFESPIAGFMLDDAVAGTTVDRIAVQPLVKARGRLDLALAVILPPLLTLRIESNMRASAEAARKGDGAGAVAAANSANSGMRMLRSTLRRSLPLYLPAIGKAKERAKVEAQVLGELLDDETIAELGITIRDGRPYGPDGKPVDPADVVLNMLFGDFTIPAPEEQPEGGGPANDGANATADATAGREG